MGAPGTVPKTVQFGLFEADLSAHEVRKNGRKIKLQEQPFQVLALLLEHPGEVVEREQLRQAVWPDGTFVEFDRSLNTAIKKIRQALGDSAENSRFIETLPRKGYRFIAPVSSAARAVLAPGSQRPFRQAYWMAGSIIVGLSAIVAALFFVNRGIEKETFAAPVPFATFAGIKLQPSFSPDGERVAFTWNGEAGDNFDIYVKQIGTEKPFRLTTDPAVDSRPAWSPDGRLVAFVRELPEGRLAYFVVPSTGGPERMVVETRGSAMRRNFAPAWTPDSKWLAFPDRDTDNPADETSSIYVLRLDTGEKRRLTYTPTGMIDLTGTFSPDGRSLVFRRFTNAAAEVYLLRLLPDLRPAEEPVQLTSDGRFTNSPSWTSDGIEIIYVSFGVRGAGTVWRMPVHGHGKPRQLMAVGDEVRTLALWGPGHRLVYERGRRAQNFWRVELDESGVQVGPPARLPVSSLPDGMPAYSPDAKRIAFASARSGHQELWVSASDGSDPRQLTSLTAKQIGPPRWSRDGKRIFFDANAAGRFDIYAVEPDGRNLRRLTDHTANASLPNLSADGHWIYFTSKRSRDWDIWKMPVKGGETTPVTTNGGWIAFESPNGKYLYYAKTPGVGSLWRRSVAGGPEQQVAAPVLGNSLAASARGIYFARPPAPGGTDLTGGGNVIGLYDFAAGQIRTLITTPRPIYWFLSVSPDQRFLLYSETAESSVDLMLVDSFQ